MSSSLTKEEEKRHILKILPILLKEDAQFRNSLYEILGQVFTKKDDFSPLRDIVKDIGINVGELTQAQKGSEERLARLEQAVGELVVAQKELAETQKGFDARLTRLEQIVGELVEAQKKTEIVIKELTQAQKGSEERLVRLEHVVGELVEAQKKTDITIKELVEAQKKTDITIRELAEAQKKTDIAIKELTEAQKRTDMVIKELTEAQKRTQEELQELVKEHKELVGEHKKTRTQLGGLSITVGYRLEDEAFKALPGLLKRDYDIEIEDRLKRQYVVDNKGEHIEVNIIGCGRTNGKKITIIGEAKTQLSKNDVDKFLRKKIKRLDKVYKEIFPILITYMTSSEDTERYAKSKGIAIYYSYDF